MRSTVCPAVGLLLLWLGVGAGADLTWPSPSDDLEEIVFQLRGTLSRQFASVISPCSNQASGPGRQNAAEWLRTGFHDMSTANHFLGTGGLDASIQYELASTDNRGPGSASTLRFQGAYLSSRTSLADLIAAGVYASVRSCGGPVVAVRPGRVDATRAGPLGVPQPQDAVSTFADQFDRMGGFGTAEMVQLVACGHTIGGVHQPEFPTLVPDGPDGDGDGAAFDSTPAVFDNAAVVEYLADDPTDPLVVGPSAGSLRQNSDGRIFGSDGNATLKALADAAVYAATCADMLQRMIDVVPAAVTLDAVPLAPYTVKPVDMQLALQPGGSSLLLTGYIRLRTTAAIPSASVSGVTLEYRDRAGGNSCGACAVTATLQGQGSGFDDSFDFFPISATIDAATGISSFTVAVNMNDGTTRTFDNNGNSYPMSDAIILQAPQSCLLQDPGALTVTAAVRNDRVSMPVSLGVSYLAGRSGDGLVTPSLNKASVSMTRGECVGQYTLYSASYTIAGGLSGSSRLDVISGDADLAVADSFRLAGSLAGTCGTFTSGATCSNITVLSPSTSGSSSSSNSTLNASLPTTLGTSTGQSSATCYTNSTLPVKTASTAGSLASVATLVHKAFVFPHSGSRWPAGHSQAGRPGVLLGGNGD